MAWLMQNIFGPLQNISGSQFFGGWDDSGEGISGWEKRIHEISGEVYDYRIATLAILSLWNASVPAETLNFWTSPSCTSLCSLGRKQHFCLCQWLAAPQAKMVTWQFKYWYSSLDDKILTIQHSSKALIPPYCRHCRHVTGIPTQLKTDIDTTFTNRNFL